MLPAGAAMFLMDTAALPTGGTVFPASDTALSTGGAVFPTGDAMLPAGDATLPSGGTALMTVRHSTLDRRHMQILLKINSKFYRELKTIRKP